MEGTISLGALYLNGEPVRPGVQFDRWKHGTIMLGNTVPKMSIQWVPVGGTLFCTRNLLTDISWDRLSLLKFVYGSQIILDGFHFNCRIPKTGPLTYPESKDNEWDQAMAVKNGDNILWHWKGIHSWCQEPHSQRMRFVRGGISADDRQAWPTSACSGCGWRPVLEPIGTPMKTGNSLQAGQKVFVWSCGQCLYGSLLEVTPYDLVITPLWTPALKTGNWFSFCGGDIAVDRKSIRCLQVEEKPKKGGK